MVRLLDGGVLVVVMVLVVMAVVVVVIVVVATVVVAAVTVVAAVAVVVALLAVVAVAGVAVVALLGVVMLHMGQREEKVLEMQVKSPCRKYLRAEVSGSQVDNRQPFSLLF